MTAPVVLVGYAPGLAPDVGRRFLAEGWGVALLGPDGPRLERVAGRLGGGARPWRVDASDPDAVGETVEAVRREQGPVGAIVWLSVAGGAGDLLGTPATELRAQLAVGVVGLVAGVRAALPDLVAARGSVLLARGGLAREDAVERALAWGAAGLAVTKAAQHHAALVLAVSLAPRGVHVAELLVEGPLAGTAFDRGQPGPYDPARVADRLWEMHRDGAGPTVRF